MFYEDECRKREMKGESKSRYEELFSSLPDMKTVSRSECAVVSGGEYAD